MSAKLNIFVTGATGYIGGTVVGRLLQHPKAASFDITALVRSAEKAKKLQSLGIKTVLGSYTDENLDFLIEAVSKADVVFAIADSDNVPAALAVLAGLKIHHEKTGKVPILIHTSGAAFITDDARGLHADHRTYSDLDTEALNALPETLLHRNVDIPVIEADKAGFVKAYIIIPGAVLGHPSGPVADLEIQNMHTILSPFFMKPAISRKQAGYFGKGLNTWSAVDNNDTADLFIVVFDAAIGNTPVAGHGPEGYYFAESFEYSMLEMAQIVSDKLFELGIASSRETSAYSQEELEKYFGSFPWTILASNAHAKADRARALGWVPKHGKEAVMATLKDEVVFYANEAST
ncbi:NAD(P)-binding protein [Pholiota conissans]|uniref:NAD(P)-binding protein n=1 Tax=Pholiota conissans TaxID=109636 RepID=A0A9P5Z9W7_9AGAR|nr:NAD(P)-binding protein [Pholiota conissans]